MFENSLQSQASSPDVFTSMIIPDIHQSKFEMRSKFYCAIFRLLQTVNLNNSLGQSLLYKQYQNQPLYNFTALLCYHARVCFGATGFMRKKWGCFAFSRSRKPMPAWLFFLEQCIMSCDPEWSSFIIEIAFRYDGNIGPGSEQTLENKQCTWIKCQPQQIILIILHRRYLLAKVR